MVWCKFGVCFCSRHHHTYYFTSRRLQQAKTFLGSHFQDGAAALAWSPVPPPATHQHTQPRPFPTLPSSRCCSPLPQDLTCMHVSTTILHSSLIYCRNWRSMYGQKVTRRMHTIQEEEYFAFLFRVLRLRGPVSRRWRLKGLIGMAAGGDRTVSCRKIALKTSRFAFLIRWWQNAMCTSTSAPLSFDSYSSGGMRPWSVSYAGRGQTLWVDVRSSKRPLHRLATGQVEMSKSELRLSVVANVKQLVV